MRNFRLTVALAMTVAAVPAFSETPVDFDKGFDPSAAVKAAEPTKTAVPVAVDAQQIGGRRTTPDCASFSFGPNDPATSGSVYLPSTEWVTECQPVGGDPRRGGGGQQCWERPGMTYRERASVTLSGRQPLLPWERDSFRVCLDGNWLSIDAIETAYDYKLVSGGNWNGDYVLAPTRKLKTRPDPVGVLGTLDGALKLTLADKWTSYYPGETLEVKWTLKREVKGWFDEKIGEGSFTAATAASYSADLSQAGKLQAGKTYYAVYSVRRVGSAISKDSWTGSLETGRVGWAPASLAFNY